MDKKNPLELPDELISSIRRAGTSMFSLGLFSLIITTLATIFYSKPPLETLITILILNFIISAVFIINGNRIKYDILTDLYALNKRFTGLIVFTFVVFIFLVGSIVPGIFAIVMLLDLFKAKKQIKENLSIR